MTLRSLRAAPLSVAHVALLLPWITAVVAARLPIRDNSFLWHVTAGRLQIDRGSVLTSDPFSFTFEGEPWRTQSWLIELLYGVFDEVMGLGFVTGFLMVSASLTFAIVLLITYRRTTSLEATALIGVLTAWLSAAFLSPRPVIVSYLLLGLVVAACSDRRLRWTLPLIIWMWASIHGSFILGIGFVVLDAVRERRRSGVGDVAVMAAAATLTAHGWGVWQLLLDFAGSQSALGLITEWATPDLTSVPLLPFLAGILLLVTAAVRGRIVMTDLWVVAPFLVFAFTATRAVLPAWIALAPLAGLAFAGLPVTSRSSGRARRVLAGVLGMLIVFPFVIPTEPGLLSDEFPAAAATALSSDRVFHDDFVGGYLIYRMGPDRAVFVDDRAELYGHDLLQAMVHARSGRPGWEELFGEWGIDQALVRSGDGLADALRQAGWRESFADEEFAVFSLPRVTG